MEYKVSEKDLIGEIKDFPIEVVQRMADNQVEQGNKTDISVFQKDNEANRYKKGFNWSETSEGVEFWNSVIYRGYFDVFFQKYPKQNQLTIQKDMETNKLILNGITLPKDTEVKVSVDDGTTIITFQKQESEVEEPKFKDGDILSLTSNNNRSYIAIFKREDDETITVHGWLNTEKNEALVSLDDDDIYIKKNIEVIRYATEEEIAKFNKEFAEQKQLKWKAEELKFKKYRWRAEKGGKFWFISESGDICYLDNDDRSIMADRMYNSYNYFQTEELANKALPLWKEFFKNLSL